MKSSTIRRSNLSKEKIAVLEALSKFNSSNDINNVSINNEPIEDGSPEVYIRQNKEKELDLLWKDFKLPKGEHSPIVYLGIGFISGIIATLLVSAIIGMSSGNYDATATAEVESRAEVSSPINADTVVNVTSLTSNTVDTVDTDTEKDAKATSGKKFGLFGGAAKDNNKTEETAQQNKEYEVQSGDTMDKIVRNFYGSYSPEKVDMVMKANNMTNPNKLSIGQKLIIPAESTAKAE